MSVVQMEVEACVLDGVSYGSCVRVFRLLAVVFFSLGLFVQGAAQASAAPQTQSAGIDCTAMSMSMEAGANADRSADREMPCKSMDLDCLVAMGCIGFPVLAHFPAVEGAKAVVREKPKPGAFAGLYGQMIRPESPPPRATLTA